MDNEAKRSSDFLKLWQTVRSPRARPAGLKSHRSLSFVSFIRCTEILSSQPSLDYVVIVCIQK